MVPSMLNENIYTLIHDDAGRDLVHCKVVRIIACTSKVQAMLIVN